VHWTLGILQHFRAFSSLRVFSVLPSRVHACPSAGNAALTQAQWGGYRRLTSTAPILTSLSVGKTGERGVGRPMELSNKSSIMKITDQNTKKLFSQAYILGGSPCSGKSTIAERLSNTFKIPYFDLCDLTS